MKITPKDPTVLGHASLQYNDWIGTSAGENGAVNVEDLYELAGLDETRWMIIGIDISTHRQGGPTGKRPDGWDVHVYALDRIEHGFSTFDDFSRIEHKHDGLPVVDVVLHEATGEDVVNCFKSFTMQLRLRALEGTDLLHSGYADHPAQEA